VNHFLGPSLFDLKIGGRKIHVRALAPLYAPIELISHVVRVFTLAVRLLANMFADHTVVGVWLLLAPAVVPAVFMGLGVMVAFLQAYVFAMLSMIYIGMALEEAH
jgi:F-type H+-transporting ATPase subunit a